MTKNKMLLVSLLSLLALTGCSDMVKLKGKVVYSDDGSPLTTGMVCFETDTYNARGELSSDGTFEMGSYKDNDGLPPGTYRVFISNALKVIGTDARGLNVYESLIDEKFTSGSTSGITVEVTPSTKEFNFEVDRYGK